MIPGALFRPLFEQLAEPIQRAIDDAAKAIQDKFAATRPVWNELIAALVTTGAKQLAAHRMDEINTALQQRGWFIPPSLGAAELSALHDIAVVHKNPDEAARKLIGYCDEPFARSVVEAACQAKIFQDRRTVLNEALAAHLGGRYALSIPVFLAQSEGLYVQALEAHNLKGAFLFSRTEWDSVEVEDLAGGLPLSEIALASTLRAFSRAMREQFAETVYLHEDLISLKAAYPGGFLSRHAVLHGRDSSYGSIENSIKALFILDTVRSIVSSLLS